MTMHARKGILAAGNWIVDQVKTIDRWPDQDALANILDETTANGGSPYNLLKDLGHMQVNIPLEGVGLIGDDEKGRWILYDCLGLGINTRHLLVSREGPTSYTDVMTVKSNGRRTFFHQRGVNALLDAHHINLDESQARIFHLGYLLLLDTLDEVDETGRTKASYLFEKAKSLGFETSTDIVSESSDRFGTIVPPSLPYIDYLFVNEYEASKITGIHIGRADRIDLEAAEEAAIQLLNMGVNKWVVLHFPSGAIAVSEATGSIYQPSVKMPAERIVSAVGAGDAFAAGVLFGLHEGWHMQQSLKLGVCSAATCLTSASCSGGILPWQEALSFGDQLGYWSTPQKANVEE